MVTHSAPGFIASPESSHYDGASVFG